MASSKDRKEGWDDNAFRARLNRLPKAKMMEVKRFIATRNTWANRNMTIRQIEDTAAVRQAEYLEFLRVVEMHEARRVGARLRAALRPGKDKTVGTPTPQSLIVAVDQFAVSAFNLAALVLPKRVLDEDLGDAMEQINLLRQIGAPRWQVILKVMTSILWALWSAIKSPSKSKVKSLQ